MGGKSSNLVENSEAVPCDRTGVPHAACDDDHGDLLLPGELPGELPGKLPGKLPGELLSGLTPAPTDRFLPPEFPRMSVLPVSPAPTRSVVFVHAHPDDETIFTGAVMHALARGGARVTLVVATDGQAGQDLAGEGRHVGSVRARELERAAEVLGVHELVTLGWADSGLGGVQPDHALARQPVATVASQIGAIVARAGADTLVGYDEGGIYPHPDHVAVHRSVAEVARSRPELTYYEATVDAEGLRDRAVRHLVLGANDAAGRAGLPSVPVGLPASRIVTHYQAGTADFAAKLAALQAHSSQIDPAHLQQDDLRSAYGVEWFTRTGPAGAIDELVTAGV
ncbi:PIG-L family deacetylase [Kineosporia sp. J2-2]|uniref:PIG-L family deacetylase n=1 Tax=Kineosporia corallincola TaxID=2835133 RepID=A0ABS5TFS0_9ACTN|nr:PIG-L deacetylase family protein [Kineosporia corallincola]MBT0769935.1 PIG-L family deacetylase [Kineosporia corallincola]